MYVCIILSLEAGVYVHTCVFFVRVEHLGEFSRLGTSVAPVIVFCLWHGKELVRCFLLGACIVITTHVYTCA